MIGGTGPGGPVPPTAGSARGPGGREERRGV